jgi:putative MATE family efflux protein
MKRFCQLIKDTVRGTDEDLTVIPLGRALLLLSVPMILEMMMESLFAIVDAFFVAKKGADALATVGLTESVIFLIYALAIGLSTATTAMVSRRIGEKKPDEAAKAAGQSILLALLLAVLLGVPGFWFAADILRLMGAEESVVATGTPYTQIMFGGNGIILFLFLINGIFRGVGNASLAMRTLILANGLNIVLDPCLIFGWGPFPEMGVTGAAVATNIGRGVGVAFQLFILFGGRSLLPIAKHHFFLHLDILLRLLKVGAGAAGQYLISSASWVFLMRVISSFGKEVVAGYTISIRVIIFAILPAWGLSNAAATLVGQNLGANRPDRAEKAAWQTAFYAMLFLLSISIFCFFSAPWIIGLFSPEPKVFEAGVSSLKIVCAGYFLFAYGMVLSHAINGAGDTFTPTLINLVAFWLIQIPLAYFLAISQNWGPEGVYWTILIAESIFALIFIMIFRQGKWKTTKI